MIRSLCLILGLLVSLPAAASQGEAAADSVRSLPRPVTGYYNVEIGGRHVLSTYLSPIGYDGFNMALSGMWTKALPFDPERVSMTFDTRVNYGSLLNPAGSAAMIDFHASFSWGMMWRWHPGAGFTLGAGPMAGLWGGLDWLTRNGNNPVAANFAIGVGGQLYASRPIRIGRLPVLLSDRITLPLAGAFFSPEYGETYYEIYLGNRKGLARFGWPGNRFGIDNLLAATLDFGRTSMQVGYRFSMQAANANGLHTRMFVHSLVLGVVPGGIGLKRKPKAVTPLF